MFICTRPEYYPLDHISVGLQEDTTELSWLARQVIKHAYSYGFISWHLDLAYL
jgi:hypothetical protein